MPPRIEEIKWSDSNNIYTPSKLLKEYGETGGLPVIVQVIKGHHGENTVDCINAEQVLLVTAFESQRRVIARDRHGQLISMPEHWPVKFRVRETGVKRSKPKVLKEIFQEYSHKLPVNAYFDKLPKWSFKTGKKAKSNLKYGGVELLSVYTEIFMKAMPIYDGTISVYERELVTLPLYVLVHMRLAEGLVEGNQAEWQKVKDKYTEDVKHINFNKVHGTSDVLLYDHRFYMFYEALKKEIHPEEMSFHFTMPVDHVSRDDYMITEFNSIYTSAGDLKNNNNTQVNGGEKQSSQGTQKEVIPTVTVTEDTSHQNHSEGKVQVTENSQVSETATQVATAGQVITKRSNQTQPRRHSNQTQPHTESNQTSLHRSHQTQPHTKEPGSTGQPVQRKERKGSDASSLHGEVIDTQTEVDELGRKTTVSIQVVNTEDEHYHSTDSGIQTNSPQNRSPQHRPPQPTVIDINSNTQQRQNCSSGVSLMRQDEQISYPTSQVDTDINRPGMITDEGPHVSKVVWVEPDKQAPAYQPYQAQVDQPMRFHLGQTESHPNQVDMPMLSQSYTDVRTPHNKAVYYMRSDQPISERVSSSRSVNDFPVRYQMSSSNTAIHRPRPSYPSSSSSVFYSLKKNEPIVDTRDTVSDIGMSPNRMHYGALHVDIPDSQQQNNAFDTYYNVNHGNTYLLGHAQQKAKPNKHRSHSAKRHHDLIPRQQVHVIDRQDFKNLNPPTTYVDQQQSNIHHSNINNTRSPSHSPVRVIHVPRGRKPSRSSSFVDVITGKIVRKKSSLGDEVDSKFEFRSLDRGNQTKRNDPSWREVPLTHSDDEEEGGSSSYTRNYYPRYRSPSPGNTGQHRESQEPLIKVHGPGVEMVPPKRNMSNPYHSYQRNRDSDTISEVKEETILPQKKKAQRYEPAPLAAQELSSVTSSDSDNEVPIHRDINKSHASIQRGDEYSSKTSTDSFSPKDSSHTSFMSPSSVEQLTPGSNSPPIMVPEPLTPTKTYRTTHTVFRTDRGGHSETVHSQTVEDITHEVEQQDMRGSQTSVISNTSKDAFNKNSSDISNVVMREKKNRSERNRSSTNSLRQVYADNRDSMDGSNIGLSVVDTEDPAFEEVLNSSPKLTGESLKGTTRSSGYGSLSSKTEEHKVVKRSKSPHVQHHNGTDKSSQHYDYAVRDSILSIKELDEFLKTQAAVDSDTESTKEPDVQISRL